MLRNIRDMMEEQWQRTRRAPVLQCGMGGC